MQGQLDYKRVIEFGLRGVPAHQDSHRSSLLSHTRPPRLGDEADCKPPQLMREVAFADVCSRAPNMNWLVLALSAALYAADSRFCGASSVPSLILPFTDCVHSRGKDGFYRGAIDVTESGARCMNWTEVAGFEERYPGKGIGEHNHCRNPDGRIRPWCFFRNHRGRVDWGYCDCKQGRTNTHRPSGCTLLLSALEDLQRRVELHSVIKIFKINYFII